MYSQATSFGWLAIRNFTYCLSPNPDSPNKPRGAQPPREIYTSLSTSASSQKVPIGTGDSVVVLYHPENTNKAIAWCNTLVAFQSMDHVNCHSAFPTCQRCDALRSKKHAEGKNGQAAEGERASKAPSGKLGMPKPVKAAGGPVQRDIGGVEANHPSDGSAQRTQLQALPGTASRETTMRLFGSTADVDVDASSDPELEAAISEFQDYCENKLTLAVRADCPLHIVKGWKDEPPFDLQRYCMSLKGTDGSTLHTNDDPNSSSGEPGDPAGSTTRNDGTEKPGEAETPSKEGQENSHLKVGPGAEGARGVVDPDDPVIPLPVAEGGPPSTSPPPMPQQPQPQPQPQRKTP
ncbi:hypothetical protein PHSY_002008 [Pseudozyma hubeiensis SY62]|uniref:Uncharacterized protein n=1 Tax=Pseudozyma hubeiensis (strain SY62) TaxID=1305764 RepID=R9P0A2_PSEHS|nr:hypothetical protein PHSY_002008 [Pseudozyma hubeiensis SY62]GAC94437.1 hypothetical protein PHSY_002008 [Pseudozyma hubeiensis SY62]